MAKTFGWKPVDLNKIYKRNAVKGGNGAGDHNRGTNWYNLVVNQSSSRIKRLGQYDDMDVMTVDVSRALDMTAEDISSSGAEDSVDFEIDFPEGYTPKKTEMKTFQEILNRWKYATDLEYKFFDWCRELVKYGGLFFRKNTDWSLKKINPRHIIGYRREVDDPDVITHYLFDPAYNVDGSSMARKQADPIPVEDLLIIKLGDEPFGQSILHNVYRTWKQMQLLEDAVVIYRIVRAPERRIFYVDVGRLSSTKAAKYLQEFKMRMQHRQEAKSGDITTEYNPQSMTEDYYVAQSGESRSSRVETLPGGESVGNITDLTMFNKKLAMGLRIPASYMDSAYSDQGEQAQFNDGRLGMSYQSELRYVGYIMRIQKGVARDLRQHFVAFCAANGIEVPDNLIFRISAPQSFAEYRKNELYNSLMNTAVSAEQVSGMSKSFVFEKYLGFDKTDVEENEYKRLLELGIGKAAQKALTEEQRYNIIYGDGSLNPNGAPDDNSGGF